MPLPAGYDASEYPTEFTQRYDANAGIGVPFGMLHRVVPSEAATPYPLPETAATTWSTLETFVISMNSSLAPLGPRTRNSEMTSGRAGSASGSAAAPAPEAGPAPPTFQAASTEKATTAAERTEPLRRAAPRRRAPTCALDCLETTE